MTDKNKTSEMDVTGPNCPAPICSTIRAAAARRADGWAPMLDYPNGGRVIGQQRFYSEYEAIKEAEGLIQCMRDYPVAFRNDHPGPNQFIDLSNVEAMRYGRRQPLVVAYADLFSDPFSKSRNRSICRLPGLWILHLIISDFDFVCKESGAKAFFFTEHKIFIFSGERGSMARRLRRSLNTQRLLGVAIAVWFCLRLLD